MSQKLYVKNMEQKIIFYCEMQGQISDGYWENANPYEHWKFWCRMKWSDIIVSPKIQGVENPNHERILKRNYAFYNKELLDIVGDRIILKVNLYLKYPNLAIPILSKNHWLIPDDGKIDTQDNYGKKKKKELEEYEITEKILEESLNGKYKRKDLNKDCRDLNRIIKLYTKIY